jgi:hypothetical protein
MRILALASIALIIGIGLSSCTAAQRAAVGTIATDVAPVASALVDTAVSIATTYELTKDPLTTKAKALAFGAIAQQIIADTANPTTTVAMLEATLNAKIAALAPNPAVAKSAALLVGGIQGALNNIIGTKVSGSKLTQTTLVALSGVAQQVVTVCKFYGG